MECKQCGVHSDYELDWHGYICDDCFSSNQVEDYEKKLAAKDAEIVRPTLDHSGNAMRYRHHKGGIYTLLSTGTHTETGEQVVVYTDQGGRVWVRPLSMWSEMVEVDGEMVPRFEEVLS